MALKKRKPPKLKDQVEKVAKGVQSVSIEENPNKKKQRTTTGEPLPSYKNPAKRKTANFSTITVKGSKGQSYTVAVPTSYKEQIPRVWEWTEERYKVAELIADGMPLAQIPDHPDVTIRSRMTIYGWLEHPEFKEHIDALILETGWANRRERISNLTNLNKILLNKVVKEIDSLKLTDKALGAVLSALQTGAKLIAQEKGEFVEESKVTQDTTINGQITNVTANVEQLLASASEEERAQLEEEFDKLGDSIIRNLTGDK